MNLPAALSSSAGAKLDDWLSPILVKELRQGMRARAFVLSFLLIQIFLILLVLGNVAAQGERNALNAQNSFFWVIIGLALMVLMPMRGLAAISVEVKNHTMETVMLTRLTAWRVVFGKWSALFAQSLLFVSAVLPYVFLRYFIGGDNVVSDFELLLFMLWMSGLLIAVAVAISSLGSAIVRIILVIVGFWMLAISDTEIFGPRSLIEASWETLAWLLVFGLFGPLLLFEYAASTIAPASENHAMLRRLLSLAFFMVACGVDRLTRHSFEGVVLVPLFVLIGVACFELAEKPRLLPRLVANWSRYRWPGYIAGIFLMPGWPSGLLFLLVAVPAAIMLCPVVDPLVDLPWTATPDAIVIMAIFGSVLVPVLICHLFWPRMKQVALMIILYNMIMFGIASLTEAFAGLTQLGIDLGLGFLPAIAVLFSAMETERRAEFLATAHYGFPLVTGLLILSLLAAGRRYFRELFRLLRTSESRDAEAPKS